MDTQDLGPVKELLVSYRDYVWQEIQIYLGEVSYPVQFGVSSEYGQEHERYRQMYLDYPTRKGKYIRPILVLLACEAMGVSREKALKTAAAMQLSEDWILLMDDLMDKSELRRGKPAFQKLYPYEQGIIISSVLQTTTWKILLDNIDTLGAEKAREIMNEMYRIFHRTVEGQSIEWMWIEAKRHDLAEEDILFTYDTKTGYYSVSGPIRLGALVAGATQEQLDRLTVFGKELATSFQIIDDVLGLGDFGGLKQDAGDIYEGKPTFLTSRLFSQLKGKDLERASAIYNKDSTSRTEEDVRWIVRQMQECGVVDYAKKVAAEHKQRASILLDQLVDFLPNQLAVSKLRLLMEFILNRTA